MLGSFVFLFPLGSLVLKVLHKALWHGIVQIIAVVTITVGLGLGVYISTQYNKVSRIHSSKLTITWTKLTKSSPNPSSQLINSSAS
jgi:positive regulator of sigma E activity